MKKTLITFLLDTAILIISFLLVSMMRYGTLAFLVPFQAHIIVFLLIWILTSLVLNKYSKLLRMKSLKQIELLVRHSITMLIIAVLILYFFRLYIPRLFLLSIFLIVFVLEAIICSIHNYFKDLSGDADLSESIFTKPKSIEAYQDDEEDQIPAVEEEEELELSLHNSLKETYLTNLPQVFEFIQKYLPSRKIHTDDSLILKTRTLYNIEHEPSGQYKVFLNLHRMNDFRRVNRFLIESNDKLQTGGYYIGCAQTIEQRRKAIRDKFPVFIPCVICFFDFIVNRIFPKLPFFKTVYFFLTNGSNRAISKTEILGRLVFCGFQIVAYEQIDNQLYFIVRKVKPALKDKTPSYGPLIKMPRVGKGGEIIYVYKLRTMHPYSEYLQNYIYRTHKLNKEGKIENDFRKTKWGIVMRKLWLDELPQLINLFRGDLKLFGVRAISYQYFSLYPPDVQELRMKNSPGLVPPFYADMPNGLDEVIESERRYLKSSMRHPFLTDCRYFFKAFYNIVFRGARSG